ncbi:DUF2637 domain-containing protein [Streptomyces sp. NPDC048340]|uniref:DUF2637 domain-containing protein n=1 Tax=Streptomyces sp. NPDC048340 TaxID=3365537 RepID=UPI003720CCF6
MRPYETPQTEAEVAANRRDYLAENTSLGTSLTRAVVGIVAVVTLIGAVGSVSTIASSAHEHDRSGWFGIAVWAGAEGVLLALACVTITASWRGQITPAWARWGMWAAAVFAVVLNLTAAGKDPSQGEILLLVAPPIATAAGIETLAWAAKSTLDLVAGADQYHAIRKHRERVIRTHRWTTRAAAWKDRKWVFGPASRAQARRAAEHLALDEPELIEIMRQHITDFIAVDAAFGKHSAPALPEPPTEAVTATIKRLDAPLPDPAPTAPEGAPEAAAVPLPATLPPATEAPGSPLGSTPDPAPEAEREALPDPAPETPEARPGSTLEERFREALPGMDPEGAEVLLDKVRGLFDTHHEETGKPPSKRAVQELIGKRYAVASVLHDWVAAERTALTAAA